MLTKSLAFAHMFVSVSFYTVKGYTRKGGVLYALKKFSDAQKTYQKALELDPNNKVTF